MYRMLLKKTEQGDTNEIEDLLIERSRELEEIILQVKNMKRQVIMKQAKTILLEAIESFRLDRIFNYGGGGLSKIND